MLLPTTSTDSWTVIGADLRPIEPVDEFLGFLTNIERSPNTVEAYARDLRFFWEFLGKRSIDWRQVGARDLGEFAAWARQPADNVAVLADSEARRSPSSVNRMLSAVVGFYEFQGRHGNELARRLAVEVRSGSGGYKPFLHGIARQKKRARAVRLRETKRLPKTLTLEQVAAVIDAQRRLRDRFLFAMLAGTGMRIGQALALRHEDIESWNRVVHIRPRENDRLRARSKNGGEASIPVAGELIRLHADYMHEEYGEVDSDFVFVNLWSGLVGAPLTYGSVDEIVKRTRRDVGFDFTPHQFRHTYASLAYRDGVQLEVIGALLTHKSPTSTLTYTHATPEDLRRMLSERGVLEKVGDLIS